MSSSASFFTQDQNWFTSQASTSATALAATTTALFSTPSATASSTSSSSSSSSSSGGSSSSAESSLLGAVGLTMMNASTGAAVLAAQEASDRVNKQTAALKSGQPTKSALNVSTQVTYSGSLAGAVNFGSTGPSSAGGFQFLTGSALTTAFQIAVGGLELNGTVINTVTVNGNTLTASTSGINAHPVFTLSLKPNSGLYTFTLVNPIDIKTSRLDKSETLNLAGLMQGVDANGGTTTLPDSAAVIQVHNGLGAAKNVAGVGVVHEGGLAYTGPNNTPAPTKPAKPTPYSAPINPLTGKGYSAAAGAASATFGASSVLTLA